MRCRAKTMSHANHTQSHVDRTRWRVAIDIEFEVAATDQATAITEAEELLEAGMAGLRLRDSTAVEVVMALPVSVSN